MNEIICIKSLEMEICERTCSMPIWRHDDDDDDMTGDHDFANGVACSNKISWNHENIERVRIKR